MERIGIVEITVEGMAALQGIPLHELPPDRKQARRTIGNGVHRAMQYWVDAHALDYTNNFLRMLKKETTSTKTRGWRCYHQIDPRRHKVQPKPTQTQEKQTKSTIENVGSEWRTNFRKLAQESGVSDKRLRELDEVCSAQNKGPHEQMMKILETIQIGDDEQCTNMAEETCNYLGIDIKLFETIPEHAALDDWTMATTCYGKTDEEITQNSHQPSWKGDPNWKAAKNITEAMKRGEGEGSETFREAKAEVDHMLSTGGVLVHNTKDPKVAKDIMNTPPVDTRWVMVRKMKKCRQTGTMVYARLRMRLALRGFKQKEGEQYDKYGTYAPVMHLGSLMLILILATLFKLHIRMADDSKAFCEGIMDYKLYTTLPKPFNTMVTEGYDHTDTTGKTLCGY